VNCKFAVRRGSGLWTEVGYTEFFDAVSFTRSWLHEGSEVAKDSDTVCANEWVTMLTSLGFPRSHPELLQLHRDLCVNGVLTRAMFTKVAPVGCFLFDCKSYGIHQARIQQITRKQGYKPAAPQTVQDSVYDLVHGGADGSKSMFKMIMEKERDDVQTKMDFIEQQKKETEERRRKERQSLAASLAGYEGGTLDQKRGTTVDVFADGA